MTLLTTTYDPATHKLVIEILQGIVAADYRKWEELATPDEFVRWAKSRASHALSIIAAAPAAPSGWMPIESAPKDRKILVCQGRNGIICTAWGIDKYGNWKTGASAMDVIVEVTHWMPIPAPPAPKEK